MAFEVVYNTSLKIFSKLYVGVRPADDGKAPLAFATPYEETAAGKKRQDTVTSWVGTSTYDHKTRKSIKTTPDIRIVDNVPMSGFKITDDIKRVYYGGGNVVWRLEHPLGWEIEIQSNNLMALIQGVGIEAGGVVPGECVLARDGAHNVLLPVSSEEYKNAIKAAEGVKAPGKVPMKDRVVGRMYRLASGEYGQYMGKMFIRTGQAEYIRGSSMIVESLKFIHKNKHYSTASDCKNEIIYNRQDMEAYEVIFVPDDEALSNNYQQVISGSSKLFKSAPLIAELNQESMSSEQAEIIVNQNRMNWANPSKSGDAIYASLTNECNVQYSTQKVSKKVFDKTRSLVLDRANQLKDQYEEILKDSRYAKTAIPPRFTFRNLLLNSREIVYQDLDEQIYTSIDVIDLNRQNNFYNHNDRKEQDIVCVAGKVIIGDSFVRFFTVQSYRAMVSQIDYTRTEMFGKIFPEYNTVEDLMLAVDLAFNEGRLITITTERK